MTENNSLKNERPSKSSEESSLNISSLKIYDLIQNKTSDGSIDLLWPVYRLNISVNLDKQYDNVNVLEYFVQQLMQLKMEEDQIAEELCLDPDLVSFICSKIQDKTKDINSEEISEESTTKSQIVWIYLNAAVNEGKILPYFSFSGNDLQRGKICSFQEKAQGIIVGYSIDVERTKKVDAYLVKENQMASSCREHIPEKIEYSIPKIARRYLKFMGTSDKSSQLYQAVEKISIGEFQIDHGSTELVYFHTTATYSQNNFCILISDFSGTDIFQELSRSVQSAELKFIHSNTQEDDENNIEQLFKNNSTDIVYKQDPAKNNPCEWKRFFDQAGVKLSELQKIVVSDRKSDVFHSNLKQEFFTSLYSLLEHALYQVFKAYCSGEVVTSCMTYQENQKDIVKKLLNKYQIQYSERDLGLFSSSKFFLREVDKNRNLQTLLLLNAFEASLDSGHPFINLLKDESFFPVLHKLKLLRNAATHGSEEYDDQIVANNPDETQDDTVSEDFLVSCYESVALWLKNFFPRWDFEQSYKNAVPDWHVSFQLAGKKLKELGQIPESEANNLSLRPQIIRDLIINLYSALEHGLYQIFLVHSTGNVIKSCITDADSQKNIVAKLVNSLQIAISEDVFSMFTASGDDLENVDKNHKMQPLLLLNAFEALSDPEHPFIRLLNDQNFYTVLPKLGKLRASCEHIDLEVINSDTKKNQCSLQNGQTDVRKYSRFYEVIEKWMKYLFPDADIQGTTHSAEGIERILSAERVKSRMELEDILAYRFISSLFYDEQERLVQLQTFYRQKNFIGYYKILYILLEQLFRRACNFYSQNCSKFQHNHNALKNELASIKKDINAQYTNLTSVKAEGVAVVISGKGVSLQTAFMAFLLACGEDHLEVKDFFQFYKIDLEKMISDVVDKRGHGNMVDTSEKLQISKEEHTGFLVIYKYFKERYV